MNSTRRCLLARVGGEEPSGHWAMPGQGSVLVQTSTAGIYPHLEPSGGSVRLGGANVDLTIAANLVSEGKTIREAKRSLKRIIARRVFRLLQQRQDPPGPAPEPLDGT
jgi:hypothetical protein